MGNVRRILGVAPTGPGAGAGSENVLIARRMIVRMKESARGKKENADIKENASGKMENAKLNVLKPPQFLLFNQMVPAATAGPVTVLSAEKTPKWRTV